MCTANILIKRSLASSSFSSYKQTFKLYQQFIVSSFGSSVQPFPPDIQHLTLFITHCYNQNLASSTVASYISSLAYIFELGQFEDKTQHFLVKKMLQGYSHLRPSSNGRWPITPNILRRIIDSLNDTVISHFKMSLFKAMFLLAFHAFLRDGEITNTGKAKHYLLREQVQVSDQILISFNHYKHSNSKCVVSVSRNSHFPQYCPVVSLLEYLSVRKQTNTAEPLFSFMDGSPVSRFAFTQQLKTSMGRTRFSFYTSHSIRIGSATSAAMMGVSEDKIKLMGRWKSDAFKKYIRVPVLQL